MQTGSQRLRGVTPQNLSRFSHSILRRLPRSTSAYLSFFLGCGDDRCDPSDNGAEVVPFIASPTRETVARHARLLARCLPAPLGEGIGCPLPPLRLPGLHVRPKDVEPIR